MSLTRRQIVASALAAGMVGVEAARAEASGADGVARLLVLERRLEAAYSAALSRGAIDAALGRSLVAQEREHVRGVQLALEDLGGRRSRAPAPPYDGPALSGRGAFARFALRLESETVAAYTEVLAGLDVPELRQPLGSIMTSGAQHLVALRELLGEPLLAPALARPDVE